ncbi:flagellar export protein FliJ [Marinococcus halophilus]|uniref:Flagellar FliJ protein n=1 Tax=Marinococcus halophilus TaxID=1371 RepID=A0A510Y249_MARHA|nr:flagellar export protein FliJ [Marinococcus halophilus]OZT81439.1 flagellar export protein FliJ [Marinococcus halophilus]GEK57395.1 hypothetical protein MHA01_03000 [Marinococcus halophilus]
MAYQFSLEQLLQLRDREKDQKVKSYNEAVDQFEQKAGALYEMLRSKEHAEEVNREKMTRGVTVRELRQQEKMLHMYEREAVVLEEAVSKARWMMLREEKAMQEAWRENRKLELMKEQEEAKHTEKIKRNERAAMDDTAVQMYLQKQTVQHHG